LNNIWLITTIFPWQSIYNQELKTILQLFISQISFFHTYWLKKNKPWRYKQFIIRHTEYWYTVWNIRKKVSQLYSYLTLLVLPKTFSACIYSCLSVTCFCLFCTHTYPHLASYFISNNIRIIAGVRRRTLIELFHDDNGIVIYQCDSQIFYDKNYCVTFFAFYVLKRKNSVRLTSPLTKSKINQGWSYIFELYDWRQNWYKK